MGGKSVNAALDIGALGTSLASTAVGATGTKTILSGISSGITGAKEPWKEINEQLLYSQAIPSILKKNKELRDERRKKIDDQSIKEVKDYSIYAALKDLDEYYEAGTLHRALLELVSVKEVDVNLGPTTPQPTPTPTPGTRMPPGVPPDELPSQVKGIKVKGSGVKVDINPTTKTFIIDTKP